MLLRHLDRKRRACFTGNVYLSLLLQTEEYALSYRFRYQIQLTKWSLVTFPRGVGWEIDYLVSCQHTRGFDSEKFPTTFRLSALLISVESLITFTSCGGQLTQLVSTFSQLSVAAAKTSSSWYHSKPSSLLNRSQ